MLDIAILTDGTSCMMKKRVSDDKQKNTLPERFELSREDPMYLAGTRLNHSAKATT